MDIIFDFLHILAAVVWVGGMVFLNFVLIPVSLKLEPPVAGSLMAMISGRFSYFAWASIILLIISGLIRVPDGTLFDFSNQYGILITAKLLIYIIMVIIGIILTMFVIPNMKKYAPAPGEAPSDEFLKYKNMLPVGGFTNMVLGIVILLITALL